MKLVTNPSEISKSRNVATENRGPGKAWALLAFSSYLWILYHLPVGLVSKLAVGASCLMGLASSGSSLLRGSYDFVLAPSSIQRIVALTIADTRLERDAACSEGKRAKAVWITIRGAWSLVAALVLYATIKLLGSIWK